MTDLFSIQPLTFLTILGAGLVYIVLTAALSQFTGGDDTDASHDGDTDSGHDTISIFSPKIIAIFMVGFGAAGVLATHYGANVITATLSGVAGGGGLGGLALLGLRLLYSQQASSEIHISDALNLSGLVTVEIPTVGAGEVGVTVKGQYLTYGATSRGVSIPRNSRVRVAAVEGNSLIVSL